MVTTQDVLDAQHVLDGVVHVTPMQTSAVLSAILGGPVHLKCEHLQRAGSFKIRGAYLRMARLSDADRAAGVVAASAGNHAQGVALAARLLGIRALVYMPHGAPLPKVRATLGYGASVEFAGATIDEALREAKAHSERTGAVLVHPFDHHDIVAGQGTRRAGDPAPVPGGAAPCWSPPAEAACWPGSPSRSPVGTREFRRCG